MKLESDLEYTQRAPMSGRGQGHSALNCSISYLIACVQAVSYQAVALDDKAENIPDFSTLGVGFGLEGWSGWFASVNFLAKVASINIGMQLFSLIFI